MKEIPEKMRASVLRSVHNVAVEERPVPVPQPDEVLIQVGSVGVCGSDVHYYEHGRIGGFVVDAPLILGHELGGTIVAVGAEVDPGRVGTRVAVEPQRPCRACEFCFRGDYNLCPKMEFYATPPIDGGFCEFVTIQGFFAHEIPDEISDDSAALMEPLSVGIAAAQKGGVKPGDTVLITGGGPIGIITAQVAWAFGAARVIVSDIDSSRRELAAEYGRAEVLDPGVDATDSINAEVFIDASGATPAIEAGIRATKSGGTVVLVGSADIVPLSVPEVAMRELNVTGIFRYTGTWPIGREMLKSGAVQLDPLVTHVYGLSQVEEALNGEGAPNRLKCIVRPGVESVADPEVVR